MCMYVCMYVFGASMGYVPVFDDASISSLYATFSSRYADVSENRVHFTTGVKLCAQLTVDSTVIICKFIIQK